MVITLSVMPMFTYPSLSLASQGAIIVLYSLQLFVCRTTDNTTLSPALRASNMETSDISMTPAAIFHRLDASNAVMTLIAIPLCHERPRLASLGLDEAGASPRS
jgi:hypothetical protein